MSAEVLEREPGVYPIGEDDWEVVPQHHGPTWDRDPTWTGPRDPDGYILPHLTLGWQVIRWIEANLLADEVDDFDQPLPFSLTNEQIRFILWFYALDPGDAQRDPTGRFLYREIVLQRLKGWGKDPIAAVIAAVEFVGPCRFAGWVVFADPDVDPDQYARDVEWARERGLEEGDPYAKPHPRAWIQVAAVSLAQTANTMALFQGLFTKECIAEHSIDMGKEMIYAYGGQKKIQAVTSSPRALEGNRPTLVIKNETHHWVKNNDGLAMADAMERNATKAKGGAARALSITNAYQPSEESVAKQEREAWEDSKDGMGNMATGLMYDSLEAPKAARLRPLIDEERDELLTPEEREILTRRYLTRVLEKVRGGAWWLDIPSLVDSILNPNKQNTASRSRRFWFNQITAAEDAWVDPAAVDSAIAPLAREHRALADSTSRGILEAGWLVHPDEPIVMFFDGSKSDDSTGLVGCRLSDGYTFTIGVWQKPQQKERAKGWLAPRGAVDERVQEAFKRFTIVAFWGDPSHTKDDEDSSTYWTGMLDKWMREHKQTDANPKGLDPKFWPVKTGLRTHAVMFDMTSSDRQKIFVTAAEEFVAEMETKNDVEEYESSFLIDGHPALVAHLKNAVRYLHPLGGTSLMKDNRESAKKIDLAVCAVGARMLRRIVLNGEVEEEKPKSREIWGV